MSSSKNTRHPSDMVCSLFVTNDFCHREAEGTCCYIHDWDMLEAFLERKHNQTALLSKTPTVTVAQKSSAIAVATVALKAAALPPIPKPSAPVVAAKAPTVTLKTSTSPFNLKATLTTITSGNMTHHPQVGGSNQTAGIPIRSITITTSNAQASATFSPEAPATTLAPKNNPLLINAGTSTHVASASKVPATSSTTTSSTKGRIASRHCKYYFNGERCPFNTRTSGCFYVHDLAARRTNLAKLSQQQNGANAAVWNSAHPVASVHTNMVSFVGSALLNNPEPAPKTTVQIKEPAKSQEASVTPPSTASSSPVSHKSTSIPEATLYSSSEVSITAPSTATTSPVSQNSTTTTEIVAFSSKALLLSTSKKHWNVSSDWRQWAAANFTGPTAKKLLAPYLAALDNGLDPRKVFQMVAKAKFAPGVPTTFHHFSLLPFELRDQIWRCAIAEEKLNCRVEYQYELDTLDRHIEKRFVPLLRSPTFLLVNGETRELAMKFYEKTFGTKDYQYREGLCWFNFDADRLFLHTQNHKEYKNIIRAMIHKDRHRILRVAVPLKYLVCGDDKEIGEAFARGFPNLESITLIAGDGREDWQWTRDKYLRARIQKWHKSLWASIYPKRPTLPIIEFQIIPAHIAHHYRIDGFKW